MATTRGGLILVVGPSGAGKDSILHGAAEALKADNRFIFPRRVVTRVSDAAAEDHETLSVQAFEAMQKAGGFILWWQAHGNHYGIPASVANELLTNHVVALNVSREIIPEATMKFPNLAVVEITADPELRIKRVTQRGREAAASAQNRALREVSPYPPMLNIHRIENNGTLAEAVVCFVTILRGL